MLTLTQFEKLHTAIRRLGAEQSVERLIREIETGKKDVRPEELVYGENGIFYVDHRGILKRIILHICDKNVASHYVRDVAREAYEAREFEDRHLIRAIHRYHLINCDTLHRAKAQGWRDKYKMSSRRDGRFYYRFTNGNEVLAINEEQRLDVCGNCIRELNSRWETEFDRRDFSLGMFFSHGADTPGIEFGGESASEASLPDIYHKDWPMISKKYRSLVGYRCENENCDFPDLSDPQLHKFLHCHHKNLVTGDSSFSNLKALCLYCHAEEPMHEKIRRNKDYQAFLRISGRTELPL